ncbi:MAG TPA: hypothetical protein VGP93_09925 [Polyangiaceae bacterium]|jgi:hypothetical protein|nr:hypothetical protein [Polyangiaceae bacterium]
MAKKNEDDGAPSPGGELLTPAGWAERKGLAAKPDPSRPWESPQKSAMYAAAEVLHGWAQDAHDYQGAHQELVISEADFTAALIAAGKYPAAPAHEPACGRKFKDRAKPVVDPHTKTVLTETKQPEPVKSDG